MSLFSIKVWNLSSPNLTESLTRSFTPRGVNDNAFMPYVQLHYSCTYRLCGLCTTVCPARSVYFIRACDEDHFQLQSMFGRCRIHESSSDHHCDAQVTITVITYLEM